MESDKLRLKAQNLFTLSSAVYLEAHKKHGEAGAVAACSDLFNKYHDAASSEEYIAATPKRTTKHIPKSGLDAENLDIYFKAPKCSGKFEHCKALELNDSDVRAFVKKNNQPPLRKDVVTNKSAPINPQGTGEFGIRHPSNSNQYKRTEATAVQPPSKLFVQSIAPKIVPPSKSKPTSLDQINNSLSKRHWPAPPPQPSNTAQPQNLSEKLQGQTDFAQSYSNNQRKNEPDKSYLYSGFRSSTSEYHLQQSKKFPGSNNNDQLRSQAQPPLKKRLGQYSINIPFKSPCIQKSDLPAGEPMQIDDDSIHPLLKGIDPQLIERIKSEIVDNGRVIEWDDIAGLESVKLEIQEAVTLPLDYPWLFSTNGMLKLQKGILLFGPPGTGKTLIAKCVSAQCQATFFSISASTLTSKWIGEGEKLVKALFAYAQVKQPSIIFIDEVDSILTKRGDNDHESSTRLKTEFMIQLDGATSTDQDRILVIGATNRPQKLDEAIIRRFSKRFYIPLPNLESRATLLSNILRNEQQNLKAADVLRIAELTEGYSGADLRQIASQAAIYRIREIRAQKKFIDPSTIRPVTVEDFLNSLEQVKATVSQNELQQYTDWAKKVGSN